MYFSKISKNMRKSVIASGFVLATATIIFSFQNCGGKLQTNLSNMNSQELTGFGIVKVNFPDSSEPTYMVGDMALSSSQMNLRMDGGFSFLAITTADTTDPETVWPQNTIAFSMDPRARNTIPIEERVQLMNSIMEACQRWSQVSGITCLKLEDGADAPAGVSKAMVRSETYLDSATGEEKLVCGSTVI